MTAQHAAAHDLGSTDETADEWAMVLGRYVVMLITCVLKSENGYLPSHIESEMWGTRGRILITPIRREDSGTIEFIACFRPGERTDGLSQAWFETACAWITAAYDTEQDDLVFTGASATDDAASELVGIGRFLDVYSRGALNARVASRQ